MFNTSHRMSRWLLWRWLLVAALGAGTAALGFDGFAEHYSEQGTSKSVADLVYLTVQLFTMESGAVDGAPPAKLEFARFLSPLVSAWAVVNAVVGLFTTQLQRAWIRVYGKHVVVCGLGRKGGRLVEHLRKARHRVVVIEPDEANPQLAHCRELGCYIINGRANDPWNLAEANLRGAKLLVTVAGDDGVNIETAVRAHDLIDQRRRRTPLRCISHISDPNLQNVFRRHDVYTDEEDPFELELFNTYETAARVMLREGHTFERLARLESGDIHLVIIGVGRLGQSILLRSLKDWQVDQRPNCRMKVTVIDTAADERHVVFAQRYPGLLDVAEVEFLQLDVHDPVITRAKYLYSENGNISPSAVFVCLDDDSQALYAALTAHAMVESSTPIIVRMSEEAGLASVLGVTQLQAGCIPGVKAVGLLDTACSLELVLGGTREILAQAIHQGYVCDQFAGGQSVDENPALAPWHRLPEDLKESNRKQADHIRAKLTLIGCELFPQPGYPLALLEFTAEEVERLAEVEHQRWIEERKATGWIYGQRKDVAQKINPLLIPWSELPEEAKGYNRDAVRRIPKVLAKADLEIRRSTSALAPQDKESPIDQLRAMLNPRRREKRQAA